MAHGLAALTAPDIAGPLNPARCADLESEVRQALIIEHTQHWGEAPALATVPPLTTRRFHDSAIVVWSQEYGAGPRDSDRDARQRADAIAAIIGTARCTVSLGEDLTCWMAIFPIQEAL